MQVFNILGAVEKLRNMILILILINDFDLKSFDDNLNNFDSKLENEINRIIVLTFNLK